MGKLNIIRLILVRVMCLNGRLTVTGIWREG